MSKVIVLGGCGAVGSVAVKTLSEQKMFSHVTIADINIYRATKMVDELKNNNLSAKQFNAEDPQSIGTVIDGYDLVLNCVGPFYKTVKTILQEVISRKINYVDVCDDVDVTSDILNMDQSAKDAGILALIGMGNSPGITNILAKLAADSLLDQTDSVDIFHAHGGEPFEGPGVIGHRFHCMTIDIPMYLDGQLKYVKYFEPDGIALRQTFDFPVLGKNIPVYPYPHPEQLTLPKYIKLKQVTNRGTVLPHSYYELTRDMCKLGLNSKEPLKVQSATVVPYDFAISYIIKQRERILKETDFGQQRGCCSVVVKGKKNDKPLEYRFHMASQSQALGEGTGIPAAIGTMLVAMGKVSKKGVFPPEGCIIPQDFIDLVPKVMKLDSNIKDHKSFSGVLIEQVDAQGNITTMNF